MGDLWKAHPSPLRSHLQRTLRGRVTVRIRLRIRVRVRVRVTVRIRLRIRVRVRVRVRLRVRARVRVRVWEKCLTFSVLLWSFVDQFAYASNQIFALGFDP